MNKKNSLKLRKKALQYLARREHTRSQLQQKLLRHGDADEANEVLDSLERGNFLSERRYLDSYIEAQARKLYGPQRIVAGLCRLGFDRSVAERSLQKASIDWFACAQRCYASKFPKTEIMDRREQRRRIHFLQNRGYHEDTIRSLVADFCED